MDVVRNQACVCSSATAQRAKLRHDNIAGLQLEVVGSALYKLRTGWSIIETSLLLAAKVLDNCTPFSNKHCNFSGNYFLCLEVLLYLQITG